MACLATLLSVAPAAVAGHELPFYPSYYPQEIRIETVAPAAAGAGLQKAALHAYLGGDPFAGRKPPADVAWRESFGAYVVITVNAGGASAVAPPPGSRDGRCAAARRIARAFRPGPPGYVVHPYPVTPHHEDYLQHFDLAELRRRESQDAAPRDPAPPLRLRARGAVAETLVGAAAKGDGDATVEEVELEELVGPRRLGLGGWVGPPWLKAGWFHAYLLHAGSMADGASRQAADALYQRLSQGRYADLAEQLQLERTLVAALTAGCERVVVGYTLRREPFNAEFSQGIENVAYDSQGGLNSAVFLRTAKLKDFPWNGWLRLGVPSRPAAAWNPIGGFSDPAGRLLWAALGDPALLPAPYGGSWVANRVTAAAVTGGPGSTVEVPADALVPEAGTGVLREVGPGKTAAARILYRVAASAFHDSTRMTLADLVYPYVFAARWGAPRPPATPPAAAPSARGKRSARPVDAVSQPAGGNEHDPAVESATALARQSLAGFRVLRVEAEVRKYSDETFTFTVPVVEVYLHTALADPQALAAVAPPWSPVPWTVMALMEEAVRRGIGAFSQAEARRRGVPWLDLARDQKLRDQLAALAERFHQQAYVPEGLRRWAPAHQAEARWAALRQFAARRGHFLVTAGPYELEQWSEQAVVLQVFRDFTFPLGVGAFDRYGIPRRAYVTRVVPQGDRLEVHTEVERIETFLRDYRLVREPPPTVGAGPDAKDVPLCRYVALGPDGAVALAGMAESLRPGRFGVTLKGRVKPGTYTVLLALSLDENHVRPEIAVARYTVEASP